MKKINYLKYGLTALMMAFAMTLCFSCSSDDDEETPGEKKESKEDNPSSKSKGSINGHDYVVLAGLKWATENVGEVNGVEASGTNPTYGYYYNQSNAITAAESWGGTWKLPTAIQWKALMDENNCTWTWKTDYTFNGKTMNGYKVSDKNDDTKFIFLPAAGIYNDGSGDVGGQGYYGYYWSSGYGRYLLFYDGGRSMHLSNPLNGMTVRPVSD